MARPPAMQSLLLRNWLSFGADTPPFELQPLNVLIGPNGSGKSNLIEGISLLQSATYGLWSMRPGAGFRDFVWKGGLSDPTVTIAAVISQRDNDMPLHYERSFRVTNQGFEIV